MRKTLLNATKNASNSTFIHVERGTTISKINHAQHTLIRPI